MKENRRRLVGRVTSDKMMKTVVVQVDSRQRHPLYGKVVSRARRFMAHDELGCAMGDTVRIVESRPLSKNKRWVVEAILNRGYHVVLPDDSAVLAESGAAPAPQPEAGNSAGSEA
jgi:small subunit ribosomal protein S17